MLYGDNPHCREDGITDGDVPPGIPAKLEVKMEQLKFGINDWRNSVLEASLTPAAKLVAMVLAMFYRDGKECYPSVSTIMDFSGYRDKKTVLKAINELQENRFIKITKGKIKRLSATGNFYEFVGVSGGLNGGLDGGLVGGLDGGVVGGLDGGIIPPESKTVGGVDGGVVGGVDGGIIPPKVSISIRESNIPPLYSPLKVGKPPEKGCRFEKSEFYRGDFPTDIPPAYAEHATRKGFNQQQALTEFAKFTSHWIGKTGKDAIKSKRGWLTAWATTWLGNARKWGDSGVSKTTPAQTGDWRAWLNGEAA